MSIIQALSIHNCICTLNVNRVIFCYLPTTQLFCIFNLFPEIPCIDKLQKSLVMGSTKNKGEILYPGDVKIKVAEPKGLNALHFEEVIYKTLVYDKKEDEPLYKGDFC